MSVFIKFEGIEAFYMPDGTTREQALKKARERKALGAPEPQPEEQPTAVVQAQIDDPQGQVRGLLDHIRDKESNNNYNILVGGKRQLPLETMTINQVQKFQNDVMLKKGSGFKSSAAGGYQIIFDTFDVLKNRLNLTGDDELLTPEFQDKLGLELLKRRGLVGFLEGKFTDEQFGTFVAKEWASFPVIAEEGGKKRGDSFHKGTGDNKALTSPEEVLGILKGVKEFKQPDDTTRAEAEFEVPIEELRESFLRQEGDTQLEAVEGDPQAAVDKPLKEAVSEQPLEADALPIDGEPDQQVAAAPTPAPQPQGVDVDENLIADAIAPVNPNPTIVGQDDTPRQSLDDKIRSTLV